MDLEITDKGQGRLQDLHTRFLENPDSLSPGEKIEGFLLQKAQEGTLTTEDLYPLSSGSISHKEPFRKAVRQLFEGGYLDAS